MLKIKLSQVGKKHERSYRVVIAEARSKRDGKVTEVIGHYLPQNQKIEIDQNRFDYWIKKGAKPTETIVKLLKEIEKWKI